MLISFTHTKSGIKKEEGRYTLPKESDLFCLLVAEPSEEEVKKVTRDFSLKQGIIREIRGSNYSRRISLSPFQFIFVDYAMVNGNIVKAKHLFAVSKNKLVIFSNEKSRYPKILDTVYNEIKDDKLKARLSYIFYRMLEEDIEENYDVLSLVEQRISSLEEGLAEQANVSSKDIISLKKQLFQMHKSLWASTKIVFSIKNNLAPVQLDKADMIILEDVYHTLQHQIDILYSQKEMLTDLLEIYVANISNNLNAVMKTLTALTVIIAVPTLISSVYGMNFKILPFAEPAYGFYLLSGFMLFVSIASYIYFWKKNWL